MDTLYDVWTSKLVTGSRRFFYLVSPNESSFQTLEEVPEYVNEALVYFVLSIFLENIVLLAMGKTTMRPNDGFSNIAHGLISQFHPMLFRGIELVAYIWVYERFCLFSLPWDSAWTWVLCMLGTDLGYYWVHRFGHELNVLWAAHQTHHSSEDYNLSTALRQSAFQRYFAWIFYLPMALFIPPAQFLVHTQFNLLYQFWIHTALVNTIGPLEYILNTPSHHRVHHGRNPYCINKNYAGVFIIWDRMFGTFEPEGDKVVYGLVYRLQFWDPVQAQLHHFIHIVKRAWHIEGWRNKLKVFIYGASWRPGKPRLGLNEDIPEVEYLADKYDSSLPWWGSTYVWVHFMVFMAASVVMVSVGHSAGPIKILFILTSLFSYTCWGVLFDNKGYAPTLEFMRCLIFLILGQIYLPFTWDLSVMTLVYALYALSAIFWGYLSLSNVQVYKQKIQ